MSTNFIVKSAHHGYALVAVSWDDNDIIVRAFDEYSGNSNTPVITIPEQSLVDDMANYPFGAVLTHQGKQYFQQAMIKLRREYGQMQGGGTYVVYTHTNQMDLYAMRLDAEKYPDLVVNDWRWMENKNIRPLLKFCLFSDDQSFDDCNKVYYLDGGDFDSTIFITKDSLPDQTVGDGGAKIVPTFTYTINPNDTITITASDTSVQGLLHFEHKQNVVVDDYVQLTDGVATVGYHVVNTQKSQYCFDVLFGFTKVITITNG